MTQHPDMALKVGATREAQGLTWVFYKNQYNGSWKAGILAHNVVTEDGGQYRLEDRLVKYATFDKATLASINLRDRDYKAAKLLVAGYEAARAEYEAACNA